MNNTIIWLVAMPLSGALATLLLQRYATAIAIGTGIATSISAALLLMPWQHRVSCFMKLAAGAQASVSLYASMDFLLC